MYLTVGWFMLNGRILAMLMYSTLVSLSLSRDYNLKCIFKKVLLRKNILTFLFSCNLSATFHKVYLKLNYSPPLEIFE